MRSFEIIHPDSSPKIAAAGGSSTFTFSSLNRTERTQLAEFTQRFPDYQFNLLYRIDGQLYGRLASHPTFCIRLSDQKSFHIECIERDDERLTHWATSEFRRDKIEEVFKQIQQEHEKYIVRRLEASATQAEQLIMLTPAITPSKTAPVSRLCDVRLDDISISQRAEFLGNILDYILLLRAQRIMHGDLKPEHILLIQNRDDATCDFKVVGWNWTTRLLSSDLRIREQAEDPFGTADYQHPSLYRARTIHPVMDLFAFRRIYAQQFPELFTEKTPPHFEIRTGYESRVPGPQLPACLEVIKIFNHMDSLAITDGISAHSLVQSGNLIASKLMQHRAGQLFMSENFKDRFSNLSKTSKQLQTLSQVWQLYIEARFIYQQQYKLNQIKKGGFSDFTLVGQFTTKATGIFKKINRMTPADSSFAPLTLAHMGNEIFNFSDRTYDSEVSVHSEVSDYHNRKKSSSALFNTKPGIAIEENQPINRVGLGKGVNSGNESLLDRRASMTEYGTTARSESSDETEEDRPSSCCHCC